MVARIPGGSVGSVTGSPRLPLERTAELLPDTSVATARADVSTFEPAPPLAQPLCAALEERVKRSLLPPSLEDLYGRADKPAWKADTYLSLSAAQVRALAPEQIGAMFHARREAAALAVQLERVTHAVKDPVALELASRVRTRLEALAEWAGQSEHALVRFDPGSAKLWFEAGELSHPLLQRPEGWERLTRDVQVLTTLLADAAPRAARREAALLPLRSAVITTQRELARNPRANAAALGRFLASWDVQTELDAALEKLKAREEGRFAAYEDKLVATLAKLQGMSTTARLAAGLPNNPPLLKKVLLDLASGTEQLHEDLGVRLAELLGPGTDSNKRRARAQESWHRDAVLAGLERPLRALRTNLGMDEAAPSETSSAPQTAPLRPAQVMALGGERIRALNTLAQNAQALRASGLVTHPADQVRLEAVPGYADTSATLFADAAGRGDLNPLAPLDLDVQSLERLYGDIRNRALAATPQRVHSRFLTSLSRELGEGPSR